MLDQLDHAIRAAASEFVEAVFAAAWRGREREAVSLFAIGYLIRQCRPGNVLHSPTQIAIEAAVPGVPWLDLARRRLRLAAARVHEGAVEAGWLHL